MVKYATSGCLVRFELRTTLTSVSSRLVTLEVRAFVELQGIELIPYPTYLEGKGRCFW